jgi:4-hydroxy-tetrahydrodipicolinate reductase
LKKIVIIGASGRMGRSIVKILAKDDIVSPGMGVEAHGSKFIGMDVGIISGIGPIGEMITDSRKEALAGASGLIDFSAPASTLETLKAALDFKLPLVIGTTGFNEQEREIIESAAASIPVMLSPNMSLGVNLLFKLVSNACKALKNHDFDIEIVEAHHRFKKDAPSGTAAKLAEILIQEKNLDKDKDLIYGRQGITGERTAKEIGVHALRAGDIVGEHTVFFSSLGERIELTHRAHTRETFASGAVAAIKFLLNSKPGLYSMYDVLGL